MNQILQLDPARRPLRRRLAALAFLDVVGYSRLMAVSEENTLHAWSVLRHGVIEPRITSWRGRVVDRAGDGIFAEFGSALDALRWAMDVQDAAVLQRQPGEPIRLRIAVHLADVIDGPDGEVQGDGVNTTARLQNHAEAGGVIVSRAVVDAVRGKTDAQFTDLGMLHLKNLGHPVHAFRVGTVPVQARRIPKLARTAYVAIGAVMLGALAAAPVLYGGTPPRAHAEQLLQQALDIKCPKSPCAQEWLEKQALYERAIKADPGFARPYAEAAMVRANFVASRLSLDPAADLQIAGTLATRAVALAPDQAFSHNARGAVLRQYPARLEEALTAYMRVLAIAPDTVSARANAGWVLLLLGRPAEAKQYLREAVDATAPRAPDPAWFNRLGLADLFLGQEGHGAGYFRDAIARQSPDQVLGDVALERSINLAAALALDGRIDDARQVVVNLERLYPSLSLHNIWSCICSDAPGFKAGMEKLRRGALLAGVREG